MVSEGQPKAGPDRTERWYEIISTLILALAALATAWAGYQASLWDGIQSSDYSRASALRTTSAEKDALADEYRLADLGVFENYVDARLSGDEELAAFYRHRFSPELEVAYDAWVSLEPVDQLEGAAQPACHAAVPVGGRGRVSRAGQGGGDHLHRW